MTAFVEPVPLLWKRQPKSRPAQKARPGRMSDAEVVRQLLDRNEATFTALVKKHYDAMERLARGFVRSPAIAQEVVQETWLAVITGLPSFEGRSSLKTWIFRILVNRAKTRGQRERRMTPISALGIPEEIDLNPDRLGAYAIDPLSICDYETPDVIVVRNETLEAVEHALDGLPASQRTVVVMRDVMGWPPEDVCDALDITDANQRVLLHRGRARVRDAVIAHEARR